jgi:hypothetical protein
MLGFNPELINYVTVGQSQGSLSSRVGLQADKGITDPPRSYAAVVISGPAHTALPSKEFADQEFTLGAASAVPSPKVSTVEEDSDRFKTVTYGRKTITGAPEVITVKHRRQPLVGVRNSASVPISSKEERFKALFMSRFSPEVIADNVEKSLKEQLCLQNLFCTRLTAKFNTYAFCHVSVIEDEFPPNNNSGV